MADPNPADSSYTTVKGVRRDSKQDLNRVIEVHEFLTKSQIYWGVIRKKDSPEKGNYRVDIFADPGYGTTSYTDIEAYLLDLSDSYSIGNRVRCYFIDGVAYIKGIAIPRGTGQYRVLMLLDDENPGTMAFDAPRFI